MKMQAFIIGFGASIKPINFGVNVATGVYIKFFDESDRLVMFAGVSDYLNIGGKKGTLIYGQVKTELFRVSPDLHPWVNDLDSLVGQKVDFSVGGSLLIKGAVSVKMSSIYEHGNTTSLVSKEDIDAQGVQVADTMIRGIFKRLPLSESDLIESATP